MRRASPLGTAGSVVAFAGVTALIALAGVTVVGVPFLTVMGPSAAGAVATAVLVAVTLLPAVVGFAPGVAARPRPDSPRPAANAPARPPSWASAGPRFVTRHSGRTVAIGISALLVVAIPALSMRLALADDGSAATNTTRRDACDLSSAQFGPGFNGPLTLLVQPRPGTKPNTAARAVAIVKTLPDVLTVTPPELGTDGRTGVVSAIPAAPPHDSATTDLVKTIRARASAMEATDGAAVSVTGPTAVALTSPTDSARRRCRSSRSSSASR
jgi:RND superfamily putative drug exporter